MAIQVRRGKEDELDISKAVPGEWLVSTDTRYVRMCFAPGIVLRMATYEAFEADMAQIQAILEEAKTVEEAIQKIYDDVQQVVIDIETASNAAQIAIEKSEESKEFATAAASSASAAKTSETNAKSSASSASTSASTATKKATEASTYAKNAKNSENTANTHATTASNKASEASTSANTASVKANDASDSALLAESYTHGGTGVRDNEDVDNAQYYKNQAERISQGLSGALLPMGTITFSQLANQTKQAGYMYNISNSFTTNNTFKEGAGYSYPEGTNVYYTADGYWDCIAGTSVIGVKGSAESSYRKGNVNITKSNIGLSNVDNTSDADKPISDATQAALGEVNKRIDESVLNLKAQIDATNSNLNNKVTVGAEAIVANVGLGYADEDINEIPLIYRENDNIWFRYTDANGNLAFQNIDNITTHLNEIESMGILNATFKYASLELQAIGWTTVTIAHGLGKVPTFVLATPSSTSSIRVTVNVHFDATNIYVKAYNMESSAASVGFYVLAF